MLMKIKHLWTPGLGKGTLVHTRSDKKLSVPSLQNCPGAAVCWRRNLAVARGEREVCEMGCAASLLLLCKDPKTWSCAAG